MPWEAALEKAKRQKNKNKRMGTENTADAVDVAAEFSMTVSPDKG